MLLEGKDLTMVYDVGKEVETYALKNVSINADKNQFTVVTGHSGGGKSSLLYILSGMRKPTFGEVNYSGKSIYNLSRDERANIRKEKFGFVFQKHFLIEYLNVLDNVLVMGQRDSSKNKERAMTLLERLEIKNLCNRKICQLSVGQRQRVAVARALINNPEVIFADEPTASLDTRSSKEVIEIFKEYSKTASVLIVTHDKEVIEYADHLIEINNAEIKKDKLLK